MRHLSFQSWQFLHYPKLFFQELMWYKRRLLLRVLLTLQFDFASVPTIYTAEKHEFATPKVCNWSIIVVTFNTLFSSFTSLNGALMLNIIFHWTLTPLTFFEADFHRSVCGASPLRFKKKNRIPINQSECLHCLYAVWYRWCVNFAVKRPWEPWGGRNKDNINWVLRRTPFAQRCTAERPV